MNFVSSFLVKSAAVVFGRHTISVEAVCIYFPFLRFSVCNGTKSVTAWTLTVV